MREVAQYIRELRRGRGYTQQALAAAARVSKRTIERVERNEGDITGQNLAQLIVALRASPEDVVYLSTSSTASVAEAKELAARVLDGNEQALGQQSGVNILQAGDRPHALLDLDEVRYLEPTEVVQILHTLTGALRESEKDRQNNAQLRHYLIHRSNGHCELCHEPAPFQTEEGTPYLEVHHIVPLAMGGDPEPSNMVALCANCHRRVELAPDADSVNKQLSMHARNKEDEVRAASEGNISRTSLGQS